MITPTLAIGPQAETAVIARIKTNCGGWTVDDDASGRTVHEGMLDRLLRGGFVLPPPANSKDGLIVLIRGKAGTGKSTLALQMAANLRRNTPHAASVSCREFFSLEQDCGELEAIYCQMIANQSRAHFALLDAVRRAPLKSIIMEEVLRELAVQMGIEPTGFPKKLSDLLEKFLIPPAATRTETEETKLFDDVTRELSTVLEPSRIRFNGFGALKNHDAGHPPHGDRRDRVLHLKDDPLSRAYEFVEQDRFSARNHPRDERPFLFIDGLSILSEEDRTRLEMASFIDTLRHHCLVGVIAYEPSTGVEESLDHQVDVVIELQERAAGETIDYVVHELHFKKTRYQEAALGWQQYKIRGFGLEIYPSVHFQVHTHGYMSGQLLTSLIPVGGQEVAISGAKDQPATAGTTGQPRKRGTTGEKESGKVQWSVLEKILGGINPGDSVALLGPRGAFKTTLTLDFLFRSCQGICDPRPGKPILPCNDMVEHSLLVSIIDNEKTLRGDQRCPLMRLWDPNADANVHPDCKKHVYLFYQRPGCIASSEFLYYLKTRLRLADRAIDRLGFWDLTQLEHRFPLLANDPMFVPALLDLFKMGADAIKEDPKAQRRVKAIFMGAANSKLSNAIAAAADNVVFCWRDRVKHPVDLNGSYQRKGGSANKVGNELEEIPAKLKEKLVKLSYGYKAAGGHVDCLEAEYLMMYVDRTARSGGKETQALHAFLIADAKLILPRGDWDAKTHAIDARFVRAFEQSDRKIQYVTEMQGFAHEAIAHEA